jgi:hypothetical protein
MPQHPLNPVHHCRARVFCRWLRGSSYSWCSPAGPMYIRDIMPTPELRRIAARATPKEAQRGSDLSRTKRWLLYWRTEAEAAHASRVATRIALCERRVQECEVILAELDASVLAELERTLRRAAQV